MDFSSFKNSFPGKFNPYDHQWTGTQKIIENPYFMLSDDMGLGKTKQAIDAAQYLFLTGKIDKVVVLASNLNIEVWYNERSGELKLHLWDHIPSAVFRVHKTSEGWGNFETVNSGNVSELHRKSMLKWYLTNYEYIGVRKNKKTDELYDSEGLKRFLKIADKRTFLILDESFYVKNPSTNRTKGILKFRQECGRVLLMNGTPVANSETELYSQLKIMDPSVTGCTSFAAYVKKYGGVSDGFKYYMWTNKEELLEDLAPYTVRRLKEDCLDLPKKPAIQNIEVPLSEKTYKRYCKLRDEFLLEMETGVTGSEDGKITAYHILSQMTKLAQICSGFLIENRKHIEQTRDLDTPFIEKVKNVLWNFKSYEKLYKAYEIIQSTFAEDGPQSKVIVWCRFKFEAKAMTALLKKKGIKTYTMNSETPQSDRKAFLEAFNPKSVSDEQAVGIVSITLGRTGLNLAGAHVAIYLSNSFSNFDRKQSEDRIYRNGQTRMTKFYNLLAIGKLKNGIETMTMDHHVWGILQEKRNVSEETSMQIINLLKQVG